MDDTEKKARIKRTFETVAATYDHEGAAWFDRTASSIVKASELGANEKALDIATGTGKVALAMAASMPGADVVGVDFSPSMLAQASTKASEAQLMNVSFEECAFDDLAFGEIFDVVTCSFGLFFVEEMATTLAQFAAQTKPGGRVVISTFAEGAFSPFTDCFARLYQEKGFDMGPPRWLRLASHQLVSDTFVEAQLPSPRCETHDFGFELPSAEAWWELLWNAGYRGLLEEMDSVELSEFKKEHLAEVQDLLEQGKTRVQVGVIVATLDKLTPH